VTDRLSHVSRIGKDLQSRLRRFFDSPLDADAKPLEVCQAVLDEIECKLQPVGRGRRVFPYNRLVVRVRQTSADRPALEAVLATLDRRLRERLAELRCEAPEPLDVKLAFVKEAPPEWMPDQMFAIDYHTEAEVPPASRVKPRPPAVQVTILKGAATDKAYTFREPVISIGRTAEPSDDLGRVRRNRVVFLDTIDGVTETVGRAHARLCYDSRNGEYRLFDERSSNGTSIIRDGATIPVPSLDPRGIRVRSGDEVHLGRAAIRVVIDDE
jgi:hypothetical protein